MLSKKVMAWALCACALCGCGEAAAPSGDQRLALLASQGEVVILPQYEDFAREAAGLEERAEALCAAPDAAGLERARGAWGAARGAWKRTEVFAFGPTAEEPLRLGPKIDAWPAREDTIAETLAAPGAIDLEKVGVYARGLPVIEALLYSPGVDVVSSLSGAEGARRCEYLVALTADLRQSAEALRDAWHPERGGYLLLLTSPSASGPFLGPQEALGELVNRMAFTVENIRSNKLNTPLGKKGDGTPDPSLVESRFSARSLDDIRDNLAGLEAIYTGRYGERQGLGLRDYASGRGLDFDAAFFGHLEASRGALDAIPGTLGEAVVASPDKVEAAVVALRELQVLIQSDIIGALGLAQTFNDNDGD
jgi:predicted lipoprotein